MQTPLGHAHSVLIKWVSLFQGLFNICEITLRPHVASAFTVDVLISGVSTRLDCTVVSMHCD